MASNSEGLKGLSSGLASPASLDLLPDRLGPVVPGLNLSSQNASDPDDDRKLLARNNHVYNSPRTPLPHPILPPTPHPNQLTSRCQPPPR